MTLGEDCIHPWRNAGAARRYGTSFDGDPGALLPPGSARSGIVRASPPLQTLVRSLEDAPDHVAVRRLLGERLRIPLPARRREEVAAVHVDAAREALERVRDR